LASISVVQSGAFEQADPASAAMPTATSKKSSCQSSPSKKAADLIVVRPSRPKPRVLSARLLQHATQRVDKAVERACNTAAPVSGFGLFDFSRSPYLGRSMPQHVQRSLERTERQAWRQKQRAAI
jgi:hypothetical protein